MMIEAGLALADRSTPHRANTAVLIQLAAPARCATGTCSC